jgi:hypothetical protein
VLVSGLKLLQSPTWPRAVLLAAALMLAAFCKLPVGFVFLISVPLALVLMPARERHPLLHLPRLAMLVAAYAPAALLALFVGAVAATRWQSGRSPGFGVQDLVGIGMGSYQINFPRPNLGDELAVQLSWAVVVIGSIGIAASALAGDWRQRWLIASAALPMLAIGLFARFWYPRYLLFTLPPFIVAAVCGWGSLRCVLGDLDELARSASWRSVWGSWPRSPR